MLVDINTEHLAQAINILIAVDRNDDYPDERLLSAIHEILLTDGELGRHPEITYVAALSILEFEEKREERIQRVIEHCKKDKTAAIARATRRRLAYQAPVSGSTVPVLPLPNSGVVRLPLNIGQNGATSSSSSSSSSISSPGTSVTSITILSTAPPKLNVSKSCPSRPKDQRLTQ